MGIFYGVNGEFGEWLCGRGVFFIQRDLGFGGAVVGAVLAGPGVTSWLIVARIFNVRHAVPGIVLVIEPKLLQGAGGLLPWIILSV